MILMKVNAKKPLVWVSNLQTATATQLKKMNLKAAMVLRALIIRGLGSIMKKNFHNSSL